MDGLVAVDRGSRSPLWRAAGRVREFIKNTVIYDHLLYPYGFWKHKSLLRTAARTQAHTYTCFYRAPLQLALVAGRVADELSNDGVGGRHPLRILVFACSNGAEAYTLAAALMARRPDLDFHIEASDHDPDLVARASSGIYEHHDVWGSEFIDPGFVERIFVPVEGRYMVRPEIRRCVSFSHADLLDQRLAEKFSAADIICAQNVMFHFSPVQARTAFTNIVGLLKARSMLLIEGMDLDLKVALTREFGLAPFPHDVRGVYQQSRAHIASNWWNYYYGAEPYSWLRRDRGRRYGSIFTRRPLASP